MCLFFTPQIIYQYGEPWWNDTEGKTEEIWEKPIPVCPPAITLFYE
jgi:hypothetical protein